MYLEKHSSYNVKVFPKNATGIPIFCNYKLGSLVEITPRVKITPRRALKNRAKL